MVICVSCNSFEINIKPVYITTNHVQILDYFLFPL